MLVERLSERDDLVIRRLILEPGEATPWHTDACERFSVVVRGDTLTIEFKDAGQPIGVAVRAGMAGWDAPEPRIHRAVNSGTGVYEEVVTFFRAGAHVEPQPEP